MTVMISDPTDDLSNKQIRAELTLTRRNSLPSATRITRSRSPTDRSVLVRQSFHSQWSTLVIAHKSSSTALRRKSSVINRIQTGAISTIASISITVDSLVTRR